MRSEWHIGQCHRSAELVEELGDKWKLACGAAESIVRSDGTDVCIRPSMARPGMLPVFGGVCMCGVCVWQCVCGGVRQCGGVCGSVCVCVGLVIALFAWRDSNVTTQTA